MSEGREKIKIEKKDDIKDFIKDRIEKAKGDLLHPSPLRMVERKHLIPEAEEVFSLFKSGEFEAAQVKVQETKEKIAKIKDEEEKKSNEAFIQVFDHEIEKKLEEGQTGEFNAQDNS
jgi:hypothetical protein